MCGKFEAGESPEECVKREVLEESCLQIREPRPHGLLMFPAFKDDDWYVFVFTAREFEGKLACIPDEKLTSLNLWPSDQIFFPWLEKDKFFSAKFINEGEKMKEVRGDVS